MTLTDMVYKVLKKNSGKKFTSKELAAVIVENFPKKFENKRKNPRFSDETAFFTQVAAEIGSSKQSLLKKEGVIIDKQARPQQYSYDKSEQEFENNEEKEEENIVPDTNKTKDLREHELYPILGSFIKSELDIFSRRIDEKKSKNSKGPKGNIWLHPDIVGIEFLDKEWESNVKGSIKGAGGNRVKLYSFEVKKTITQSNLRECFFQAVSNSSWANQGFLVAAELKTTRTNDVYAELKMLSTLHGIGVILLNTENPSESQILFPSREKSEPDWVSINRLVKENRDFESFITSLKIYYLSSEININEWFTE